MDVLNWCLGADKQLSFCKALVLYFANGFWEADHISHEFNTLNYVYREWQ